jgi:hypothetical protein
MRPDPFGPLQRSIPRHARICATRDQWRGRMVLAMLLAVLGGSSAAPALATAAPLSRVPADASRSVTPGRADSGGSPGRRLSVGGHARRQALLRFRIPNGVGPIAHATLRLWAYRLSGARLEAHVVVGGQPWSRRAGGSRGVHGLDLGPVAGRLKHPRRRSTRGRWLWIDVSRGVRSSGTVTLGLTAGRRAIVTLAGHRVRRRAPMLLLRPADSPSTVPPPAPTVGQPSPSTPPSPSATAGTTVSIPPLLSDGEAAARVVRSPWEPRPGNAAANQRVPSGVELAAYRDQADDWRRCHGHAARVTGAFTGTTDEIIQWAAFKWGLEPAVVRAVAAVESWWDQAHVGDGGQSFGLMQIKRTSLAGTFPTSQLSTAFNLDVFGATIRAYYDGCATWLDTVPTGRTYAVGDLWGSIGAWYAGRWHDDNAEVYIARVMQAMSDRVWLSPSF